MLTRTSEKTWTFTKPFRLKGVDRGLAAGSYRVMTDEEMIEGLSFTTYPRVATMIFAPGRQSSSIEMLVIDPADLEAALERDAAAAKALSAWPIKKPRGFFKSTRLLDLTPWRHDLNCMALAQLAAATVAS